MTKNKPRIPEDMQRWIDARKRFHLSHAQVQMARELGMNPPQARLTGQPQARTLESSASGLHRPVLSQALWQSSARPCYFRRGPSTGDCREESRKARTPERRRSSQRPTTRSIKTRIEDPVPASPDSQRYDLTVSREIEGQEHLGMTDAKSFRNSSWHSKLR